jgi:hypothetical protein
MRIVWCAALAIVAMVAAGGVPAASSQTANPVNPANDALMKLAPGERAARLAQEVGQWCIGTEAFLMGVVTAAGPGEGYAYWSLRCADGTAWAVQVDPLAEVTAIDCDSFNEVAMGKECFKKF